MTPSVTRPIGSHVVPPYFLDTGTLIDFAQRQEPVSTRLLDLIRSDARIAISAIQIGEFFAGLAPNERADWARLLDTFSYWDISSEAAIQAGIDRYEFARRGVQLSLTDCLIGAIARERSAVLLTNNLRHFPMAGIRTLSLRVTT
jgi:predicted nucleic acid-binding protein